MPSLVEINQVVLNQCLLAISQLSPFINGFDPSFERTWVPFTEAYFVSRLVGIGSVVLKKKSFKFRLFHHYLRLKKGVALQLNKLESCYPKMLWAKFSWNGPVVLEKTKMWFFSDRRTHDRQPWSEKLRDLSSDELKINLCPANCKIIRFYFYTFVTSSLIVIMGVEPEHSLFWVQWYGSSVSNFNSILLDVCRPP